MKRAIKNILMILLILVLIFLTYFTFGYLKGDKSLIAEFKTDIVILNEDNNISTETTDDNGNITTAVYEESGDGTGEVIGDPDATVSNSEEPIYQVTEEDATDTTTTGASDNLGAEKSLNLTKIDIFNIPTVYLLAFCVECLLISFILSYLAYSKFNKLTLKETFYSKARLILYILYSFVLAINFLLTINYFIKAIN